MSEIFGTRRQGDDATQSFSFTAPGTTEDSDQGWRVGMWWFTAGSAYLCVDASPGAAVWKEVSFFPSALTFTFHVVDSDGAAVTGLTSSDFTISLQYLSSGAWAAASETVTFAEIGSGDYSASFTPTLSAYYALSLTEGAFTKSLGLEHRFEVTKG